MKKMLITFFILSAMLSVLIFANASVQDIIITPTNPSSLKIQMWMDRPTGATYYPGERARIYLKTSEDAYVTIYDYTTDGEVRILFPNFFQRNNHLKGGIVYTIPDPQYNYSLVITGPKGREFLEAIASTSPNALPPIPLDQAKPFVEIPDGQGYMQKLKLQIVTKPIAVATTYFYVGYTPQTAVVNFTSTPIGASLYVDGIYEGETPQTIQLPVGNHVAIFRYNGNSVTKTFTVEAGQYQTVNAVIPIIPTQPLTVSVSVSTYPSGALVFVNGRMLEVTPCKMKLSPGTYEFTLVKPGYRTVVRTIVVENNMNLNFNLNKIGSYSSY